MLLIRRRKYYFFYKLQTFGYIVSPRKTPNVLYCRTGNRRVAIAAELKLGQDRGRLEQKYRIY